MPVDKLKDAILSPLVADGLRLLSEFDALKAERDLLAESLKAKDAELQAVNTALIAQGTYRYRDEAGHTCLVVAGSDPIRQPDGFTLRSAEDEATARELAGKEFLRLFDRTVYFTPKPDFRGLALGKLPPKRAESLIALCLVPGELTGGRKAYVKWK